MSANPAFGHSQARLQARFAALPGPTEWQRLSPGRTYAAYIEDARLGPLQPWVKGLSAVSDAHEIDRGLRALAAGLVEQVAGWVPGHWGPAIRWLAWLAYLPIIEPLTRGQTLPPWALDDYRLRPLLDATGAARPEAIAAAGLAPLLNADPAQDILSRWTTAFRSLWPAMDSAARAHLDGLIAELRAHGAAFQRAAPADAWDQREKLRERLRLQFHQRPLEPVTAMLYLALVFLDLERLRGELLRRKLFPESPTDLRAA